MQQVCTGQTRYYNCAHKSCHIRTHRKPVTHTHIHETSPHTPRRQMFTNIAICTPCTKHTQTFLSSPVLQTKPITHEHVHKRYLHPVLGPLDTYTYMPTAHHIHLCSYITGLHTTPGDILHTRTHIHTHSYICTQTFPPPHTAHWNTHKYMRIYKQY